MTNGEWSCLKERNNTGEVAVVEVEVRGDNSAIWYGVVGFGSIMIIIIVVLLVLLCYPRYAI